MGRGLLYGCCSLRAPFFQNYNFIALDCSSASADSRGAYNGAPILNEDSAAVVVMRPVVNIDDPFELELAKWLLMRQTQAVPQLALANTA